MTRSRCWIGALLASGLILTAAGCTGTDFLNTGNATVRIEVAVVGTPVTDWDCLIFEMNETAIRPLDGTCGADSGNADEVCLNDSDCTAGVGPGTCVGSSAGELIGTNGIVAVLAGNTEQGDLVTGPCVPTNDLMNQFFPEYHQGAWVAPGSFVLADGLYEITTSDITNIKLYVDDPDALCNPTCPDQRQCLATISIPQGLGEGVLRFTMEGVDKVIRYEIDIAELEQVFQPGDANNCNDFVTYMDDVLECVTCDAGVAP